MRHTLVTHGICVTRRYLAAQPRVGHGHLGGQARVVGDQPLVDLDVPAVAQLLHERENGRGGGLASSSPDDPSSCHWVCAMRAASWLVATTAGTAGPPSAL